MAAVYGLASRVPGGTSIPLRSEGHTIDMTEDATESATLSACVYEAADFLSLEAAFRNDAGEPVSRSRSIEPSPNEKKARSVCSGT